MYWIKSILWWILYFETSFSTNIVQEPFFFNRMSDFDFYFAPSTSNSSSKIFMQCRRWFARNIHVQCIIHGTGEYIYAIFIFFVFVYDFFDLKWYITYNSNLRNCKEKQKNPVLLTSFQPTIYYVRMIFVMTNLHHNSIYLCFWYF